MEHGWAYFWGNVEGAVGDVEVAYYEDEKSHGDVL